MASLDDAAAELKMSAWVAGHRTVEWCILSNVLQGLQLRLGMALLSGTKLGPYEILSRQ
jgi:hypothetical protein